MMWKIKITDEAKNDFAKFDKGLKGQILKGIFKVSKNPLSRPDGYGKPLGNKSGNNLTGFFKIKYRDIGIRVVYTLALDKQIMNVAVISERDDNYCYEMAAKLYKKYDFPTIGSKEILDSHNIMEVLYSSYIFSILSFIS